MPGNPLNITLPTVGSTLGPIYATLINAAIQALIDDVEAKVTPDEMSINSNLSFKPFGTAYAATDLERTQYESQGSVLAAGNNNSVYSKDGELHFQDGSGNDIPVTSSGGVAAAAGNITTTGTPAYASSGVEILWSGGDLEYRFKDGSGANSFADIVFANAEFRNGANTMTMRPSASLASDYAVEWPAALPASQQVQQIDASGNVSFSNDFVGDVDVTGDVDISGDLNLVGDYSHGNRELAINPIAAVGYTPAGANITHSMTANLYSGWWTSFGPGSSLTFPISLDAGDRIKSVRFLFEGTDATTKEFYLRSVHYLAPTVVTEASGTSTASINTTKTLTLPGSGLLVAGNTTYYAIFVGAGALSAERCYGIVVTYDHPA